MLRLFNCFRPEGIKKELTSLVDKYKNNHPLMGKAIIINIEKYVGDVLPKRSGSGVKLNDTDLTLLKFKNIFFIIYIGRCE